MRAVLATTLGLALVLPLAGCDKPDKGPKTLDQAKAEAAQLSRPAPGQYRQTTKITRFEVPGAPPQMAERMKQMMGGTGQTATYCLSKADAEKGFEEMFKNVGKGECRYDRFDATSGTIDAIMVCKTGPSSTAKMAMNGTVSTTGSSVKVDVEQTGGSGPMDNAKIGMDISSERISDCPAGAATPSAPAPSPTAAN
jgi:hypothetical protein